MPKTGGDKFVSSYYGVTYTPHLSHHGIKGMKWGIRRYQNPDGTLTEEGRARYGQIVDRGRDLRERGKTSIKVAVKAMANHYAMALGKGIAENMITGVVGTFLSAAAMSNPITAMGKTAFDAAFAVLQIKNMTDAVKDIRALDAADKVKETTEEMKTRAERSKIQADISSNSEKTNNARNGSGSGKDNGGNKSPSIVDDPAGFAKAKAAKLASDVTDSAIKRLTDKIEGKKNDGKKDRDKDDNDGDGKKKKNKGGNDGGNNKNKGGNDGGNNKKDDAKDRPLDIEEVLAHPERHSANEIDAATKSSDALRKERAAREKEEEKRKEREKAEQEKREKERAGEAAAERALREATRSGRSLSMAEYNAIANGRASYIGRNFVDDNLDWMDDWDA